MTPPSQSERVAKVAQKLLHDMASEIEMAFSSHGKGDYVIEIPATDARRLLRRYEKWRKLRA